MAEKRTSTENRNNLNKKMKNLKFTSTELFNKIIVGDQAVSVVAYVDHIIDTQTYSNKGQQTTFDVYKFVLNNNNGVKVQCNVFNQDITTFKPMIKKNQKILVENAKAIGKKEFSKGNVAYDLTLRYQSSITELGEFNPIKDCVIQPVTFEEVQGVVGYIKIRGYLRNSFSKIRKNEASELMGVLTDGNYKLDVLLYTNGNDIDIERGTKLEIIGDLQEHERSYILVVKDFDYIKLFKDDIMELEDLLNGVENILNSKSSN